MTIHTFSSGLADRIPEMARDSKINNQKLIENLLAEFMDEIEKQRLAAVWDKAWRKEKPQAAYNPCQHITNDQWRGQI